MPRTSERRRQLAVLSLTAIVAVQIADAAGPFVNGQAASVVLGQPDFVSAAAATPVPGSSLNYPVDVAADASGNIWVADHFNARVLLFMAPFTNGKTASVVIGQPDLISQAQNNDGRTARSLGNPNAVAVDASGNLWVADGGPNNRVFRYSPPFTNFMPASLVLGAPDFTSVPTGASPRTFGSAGSGGPTGLAFDPSGNLWVVDEGNSRVLRFDAPFTNGQAASVVLGQPDFVSSAAPATPTASSLNGPSSVAVDSAGNVWVADRGNNRVLQYTAPVSNGQAASTVIGQTLFTSNAAAPPTAASVQSPTGVSADPGGQLWIVEAATNRILGYNPPFANGQAASVVLGQPDFTSNAAPSPPTASSVQGPWGSPAFIGPQLWIADRVNNRVLQYAPPSQPPPVPPTPDGPGRIVTPPDFPYKVTFEQRCVEAFGRLCLRTEIVRVCVGGNCFDPRPDPDPPCVRCYLGYGAAAGAAVGAVGALLLRRRRKP